MFKGTYYFVWIQTGFPSISVTLYPKILDS